MQNTIVNIYTPLNISNSIFLVIVQHQLEQYNLILTLSPYCNSFLYTILVCIICFLKIRNKGITSIIVQLKAANSFLRVNSLRCVFSLPIEQTKKTIDFCNTEFHAYITKQLCLNTNEVFFI